MHSGCARCGVWTWRKEWMCSERGALNQHTGVFEVMKEWGGQVVEIPYTQGINSSALADNASSIGTTPDVRRATLRRLIAAKKIVRIMEAHSGLSGLIVENAAVEKEDGIHRFDGMWSC